MAMSSLRFGNMCRIVSSITTVTGAAHSPYATATRRNDGVHGPQRHAFRPIGAPTCPLAGVNRPAVENPKHLKGQENGLGTDVEFGRATLKRTLR